MFASDLVLRAEVLWALKTVHSNFSYASSNHTSDLFREMFKDSNDAKKFRMGKTKNMYIINFGIAPALRASFMRDLKGVPFTFSFDETGTSQGKKQYDCYIKYKSYMSRKIVVRYLDSEFVGHCTADHLLGIFNSKIKEFEIAKELMLQIEMDGPNVNKLFLNNLNIELLKHDKTLIEFGTCVLHPVATCFKNALNKFTLDFDEFVIDVHSFFKFSACRKEDFKLASLITDIETFQMMRHVSSRWLSLKKVLQRILDQWDNLIEYFLNMLPKMNNFNDVQKKGRYQRIVNVLKSSTAKIAISFAIYVATILEKHILLPFQSDKPNIHLIYKAMGDLLYSLLIHFVRKDYVGSIDAYKLGKIETKKVCKPIAEIMFGKSTEDLILRTIDGSIKNRRNILEDIRIIKEEMKLCYIDLVERLQKKLNVRSRFLQYSAYIDPNNRFNPNAVTGIKYLAQKIGNSLKSSLKMSESDWVDKVVSEFNFFILEKDIPHKFDRLDDFWFQIEDITEDNRKKYKHLCDLCFHIMTLSVTNVEAERGFSINKMLLDGRESMSEITLKSYRLVKDSLIHNGNEPHKFPISQEMLSFASKASRKYKDYLEDKKQLESTQKHEEAQRKMDLENQRKQQEQKKKQKDMEVRIQELKSLVDIEDGLLRAANEKIKLGISTKSMAYISDGQQELTRSLDLKERLEKELKEMETKLNE